MSKFLTRIRFRPEARRWPPSLGLRNPSRRCSAAVNLSTGAGDDFDTVNPGKAIWGWELPGTGTNGNPEGVQTNCIAGCTVNIPSDDPNAVFAALGSIDFATVGPHDFIRITTNGPTASSPLDLASLRTTTLGMSGAYTGNGRVAELTGASTVSNYDTFTGLFSRTATPGDTDLTHGVDLTDFKVVLVGHWYRRHLAIRQLPRQRHRHGRPDRLQYRDRESWRTIGRCWPRCRFGRP